MAMANEIILKNRTIPNSIVFVSFKQIPSKRVFKRKPYNLYGLPTKSTNLKSRQSLRLSLFYGYIKNYKFF